MSPNKNDMQATRLCVKSQHCSCEQCVVNECPKPDSPEAPGGCSCSWLAHCRSPAESGTADLAWPACFAGSAAQRADAHRSALRTPLPVRSHRGGVLLLPEVMVASLLSLNPFLACNKRISRERYEQQLVTKRPCKKVQQFVLHIVQATVIRSKQLLHC